MSQWREKNRAQFPLGSLDLLGYATIYAFILSMMSPTNRVTVSGECSIFESHTSMRRSIETYLKSPVSFCVAQTGEELINMHLAA